MDEGRTDRGKPTSSGLAAFVRAEIDKRGMSESTFAERVGISKGTLSNMLNKPGVIPDLSTLHGIAQVLDLPLARIIEVCGYAVGGNEGRIEDIQLAMLMASVPELRQLVDQLKTLSLDDLTAIESYVRFYIQEQQKRQKKG